MPVNISHRLQKPHSAQYPTSQAVVDPDPNRPLGRTHPRSDSNLSHAPASGALSRFCRKSDHLIHPQRKTHGPCPLSTTRLFDRKWHHRKRLQTNCRFPPQMFWRTLDFGRCDCHCQGQSRLAQNTWDSLKPIYFNLSLAH